MLKAEALRASFLAAFLCALAGFAWQALTVRYNHGGDWSALWITAEQSLLPASIAAEHVHIAPGAAGYDGQMYHIVAHDPLLLHDSGRFLDSARLRYRRILLPAAAYLLAAGRQGWIDRCYIAANLLFLFLGALWLSLYLTAASRSPFWAILFVLVPASLVSLDRLTIDLSFASLCAGFAWYTKIESRWRLWIVMALACLSRETGLVLPIAFFISEAARRRFANAAITLTAPLPAALWYHFIDAKTQELPIGARNFIPIQGIVEAFIHPRSYPFSPTVNTVILTVHYVALLGLVLGCVLAFISLYRDKFSTLKIAAALWALGALTLPAEFWGDCCSAGRVFTPMLLFLALEAARHFSFVWIAPLLLVSLRVWLELLSPLLGIIRGLFGHKIS